jgi:AcrR family transcriptional regulator
VPKLWTETIDAHRTAVREATLDSTAALVARHGLAGVTMSQIAKETGIGRATLYKYFPDVEAILIAWHQRQISNHLDQLAAVRDHTQGTASQRLEAVLTAYAQLSRQQHDTELAAVLHRGDHVAHAEHHLRRLVADLIAAGARDGDLRDDVAPTELAAYCLFALTAAGSLPSQAAVRRLVSVTLTGLRPATPTTAPASSR